MNAEQMLQHVAAIIADRGAAYGDAATSMAAVAARWSITLGHPVTPAQVVLCLIDLKLARLAHNPDGRLWVDRRLSARTVLVAGEDRSKAPTSRL